VRIVGSSGTSLPVGFVVVVGVLVVAQLTLQVVALLSLVRLPSARVSIGGRKWVWALIIVFGELVGSILYFVVGRLPVPAPDPSVTATGSAAQRALDVLYGERPEPPDVEGVAPGREP